MIIAIGGGQIDQRETYEIDQYIVNAAHTPHPQVLFVPTASHDAPGYIEAVREIYTSLGCTVDALCLSSGETSADQARAQIEAADIIYVGGGNTEYMMNVWHQYGVDECLREAYIAGKVLCGLSAGSICWFIAGHSDSEFVAQLPNAKNKWVKGLGFIPFLHCPHYNEPPRAEFDNFYVGQLADAIALENQTALVWDNHQVKIISANPERHAYRFFWVDGIAHKEVLTEALK